MEVKLLLDHARGREVSPRSWLHEQEKEVRHHFHFLRHEETVLFLSPSWRRRWSVSFPHTGGGEASPLSIMQEEVALLLSLSCRRCTSQCLPSVLSPRSWWWGSCWRSCSPPLWLTRNCRCWRSSGRFRGAPDTLWRAWSWTLADNYLVKSETGRRPHHLHLYAATQTGSDIVSFVRPVVLGG